MDERLLGDIENCPVVSRDLGRRLVDEARVRLHLALHLEVDHATQLDRVLRLVQEKVVCYVLTTHNLRHLLRLGPRAGRGQGLGGAHRGSYAPRLLRAY